MLLLAMLLAGATGFSTQQARTAAPGAVNLSGVASAEGSSLGFARADHTHGLTGALGDGNLSSSYSGVGVCSANTWASTLARNAAPTCTQPGFSNLSGTASTAQVPSLDASKITTGTLPQARGGTGAGALTCSAGDFITSNGTAQSCATPTTGGVTNQGTSSAGPTSCSHITNSTILSITASATGNYFLAGIANTTPATGDTATLCLTVNGGACLTGTSGTVGDAATSSSVPFAANAIAAVTSGNVVRLTCQGTVSVGTVNSSSLVMLKVN